jgi:hypothetical protein
MDLAEIGREIVDWMHLAQGGGNEPSGCIKGGEFFD